MRRLHLAAAVAVAAVWGLNFVVLEIGLRQFPPLLFAALRFVLVVVPWILVVPRPNVRLRWLLTFGLLMGVGQFGLLFIGMELGMPAGLTSLVLQSQAIFTLIFGAVVLRERLSRRHVAGTVLASVGILLVAMATGGSTPLSALLLVLAAAASWGAANVTTRLAKPPPGLGWLVWASLVPPLPLLGLSLLFEGPERMVTALTTLDLVAVASIVYVVGLATLLGFGVWTDLMRRYPAGLVAPYSLLVPVFGMLSAWLILHERPGPLELLGACVVAAGLALVSLQPGARRRGVPGGRRPPG